MKRLTSTPRRLTLCLLLALWAVPVAAQVEVGQSGSPIILYGTGSPEGAVTGSVGDVYLRTDGGAGTTTCFKESGSVTTTGWKCAVTSGSLAGVAGQVAYFTGTNAVGGDTDFTFSGATASVTNVTVATALKNTALTATRVPVIGAAGLFADDADFTFTGGNTLSSPLVVASTSVSTPSLITAAGNLTITPAGTDVSIASAKRLATSYGSGWAGTGYVLDYNSAYANQSFLELDRLSVRGIMNVYELLVHQIRATNGSIFVANTGKASAVTDNGAGSYTITTEGDHGFAVNDLIRAQRFSALAVGAAVYQSDLTVTAVADTTHFTATLRATYTVPAAGMEFVRLGNTTDVDRQGSIYLTADDTNAPYINVLSGVAAFTDWGTTGKTRERIGNLNGWGEYVTNVFGLGAGDTAATNVTIDAVNGFRIRSGTTNKLVADTSGNLALTGNLSVGTAGAAYSSAGAITCGTGAGWYLSYNAGSPCLYVGEGVGATDDYLLWNGSALTIHATSTTLTGAADVLTLYGDVNVQDAAFQIVNSTVGGDISITTTDQLNLSGTVVTNSTVKIAAGAALSGGTPSTHGLVIPIATPGSTAQNLYSPSAGDLYFNGVAIALSASSNVFGSGTANFITMWSGTNGVTNSKMEESRSVNSWAWLLTRPLSTDYAVFQWRTAALPQWGIGLNASRTALDIKNEVLGTYALTFAVADNNAIFTGTVTAPTFIGAVTGNASTATALAANPADCAANQFANAIAASGALTCAAIADADVPDSITITLAATATALANARTIGGVSFNGTANIVPASITVADTADATSYVGLWESATGDLLPKTDAGLTYNATTGMLTATGLTGPLTGNASTATALAADPADCGASTFAYAINASGTLTCSTVGVAAGGTAITSYAVGDLLYASAATTLAKLADVAAGSYLRSGGVITAPVWSTLTLPNTAAISTILYASSANVVSALATANSGVLVTGGTGVPSIATDLPTAVTIGAAYIYRAAGTDVALADGGTNASLAASTGGIVYSGAGALAILAGTATAGQIVRSGASAAPTWSTATYPATVAIGELLHGSAANVVSALAAGAAGYYLKGAGAAAPAWTAPAALTKTDDTNVTATLGGAPTTALLNAASITLGWTGTLSLTRGGTAKALTASAGGIVWTDADSMEVLAGTATAGQMLRSGASLTPAWSTATWPATATTASAYLRADGTNWITSTLLLPNAATSTQVCFASAANTVSCGDADFTFSGDTATATKLIGTTNTTTPTLYGSAADNGDLTIEGTASATKTTSYVILQPTTGNVGIGTTGPTSLLHVTTTGSTLTDNVNIGGRTSQEAGSALKLSPSIQVVTAATTNMYGLNVSPTFVDNILGADITNYSSIYTAPITGTAGAITNVYGLYIAASTVGANNYGAYIAGNVGLGTTGPDKAVEINSATGANLRLTYNDANGSAATYADLTTSTAGILTIDVAGSDPSIAIADSVSIATEKSLATAYGSGWSGSGYTLNYNASYASESFLEVDRLSVRGIMNVYELLVHQIRATNGSIFVANTGKAKAVTDNGASSYTIETDGDHGFAVNDLLRAQRFTTAGGGGAVYQSDLTVTAVADTTHFTATLRATYTVPAAGMDFVRLGNTTDADRQGSIYLTADDTNAPYLNVLSGVDSFAAWGTTAKTRLRAGNLNGWSDYATNLYGLGIGDSGAVHVDVDATNGVRFRNNTTTLGQLSATTWTLGSTGSEHVAISSTAVQVKDGATVWTDVSAGVVTLGQSAAEHAEVSATSFSIRDGATVYTDLTAGALTLGQTASEHVAVSATAVQIKDGATVYADLTAGALSLGSTAIEHVLINTSGVALKDAAVVYGVFAATTTLGVTTEEHLSLTSSGIQFKNSATVNGSLSADVWTLGQTAAEYLTIDTSGISLYDAATMYARFAATTTLGATGEEHLSLTSSGIQFKNAATVNGSLAADVWTLGQTAAEHILLNTSGLAVKDGANIYAQFAATTTVGLTASEHVSISATAVQMKDGATVYTDLAGGVLTLGETADSKSRAVLSAGAFSLISRSAVSVDTTRVNLTTAGVLTLGSTAAEHLYADGTSVQIKDGATVYTDLTAGVLTLGEANASPQVEVSGANGIIIRDTTTTRFQVTTAGVVTINDSAGAAVITLDAATGAQITKKLTMDGASSAISIGVYNAVAADSYPTDCNAGTGIWIDRTEFCSLDGNTTQVKIDATTGKLTAGAGAVTLDANGIAITASGTTTTAINSYGLAFGDTNYYIGGWFSAGNSVVEKKFDSPAGESILVRDNLVYNSTGGFDVIETQSVSATESSRTIQVRSATGGTTANFEMSATTTANSGLIGLTAYNISISSTSVTLSDNVWLGLGSAAGRIEFDDQATDEVNILNANVGIQTSTPTNTLGLPDNATIGLGSAAGQIEFDDQATDEVNILNANVGIGTATPASKLFVYNSGATTRAFYAVSDANDGYTGNLLISKDYGTFIGTVDSAETTADILSVSDGVTLNADKTVSSVGNVRLVIKQGGAVGINDTTPSYQLEVNGTLGVQDDAYFALTVSALVFTDRTAFYRGDALAEIARIRATADGSVDHATLPATVQRTTTVGVFEDRLVTKQRQKTRTVNRTVTRDEIQVIKGKHVKVKVTSTEDVDEPVPCVDTPLYDEAGKKLTETTCVPVMEDYTVTESVKVGEKEEPGRSLGDMISVLTVGEQQLIAEIATLKARIAQLERP